MAIKQSPSNRDVKLIFECETGVKATCLFNQFTCTNTLVPLGPAEEFYSTVLLFKYMQKY